MNLQPITMDRGEALERAAAYEELRNPTDEERAIWQGFAALAAGKTLINLPEAIARGGHDENGWPRLAVMGALEGFCHLEVSDSRRWNGVVRWSFSPPRSTRGRQPQRNRFTFSVPVAADVAVKEVGTWQMNHRRAIVPNTPPELRPRGTGTWRNVPISLRHFVVLWEVPEWEPAPRPPGDPALLRHLGGDLWTVEAIWDLTPLEQAVISGRQR